VILISNIVLEVLEGSTIASTEIYGADKKTYVNIGSGNVFNLKWSAPTLTNETVNYYNLIIKRYDPTTSVYYNILDRNIGLVNYFSVNSEMLPAAPEQYLLHIYVVAYGKQGSVVTSNIETPYVCKGSGTYVKTKAGNTEYMKRALALVNAPTTNNVTATLRDITGKELQILSADGSSTIPIEVKATRLLSSSTWNIVQESSVKGADGSWHKSDIQYEALLGNDNEIITDSTGKIIYVL
jgi:hypothetical protein